MGKITLAPRRQQLLNGLKALRCADCAAAPGAWCNPLVATEQVRTGQAPPRVLHSRRMADAVQAGHAPLALVLAQFGSGTAPQALRELACTPQLR